MRLREKRDPLRLRQKAEDGTVDMKEGNKEAGEEEGRWCSRTGNPSAQGLSMPSLSRTRTFASLYFYTIPFQPGGPQVRLITWR